MSSSRGATGAGKPRPQNVNSVYSGRNTAAGKASGPSKHGGLQTLGKAPAVVRRMPPPATLPSLKAEHGQDPNVVLVPQGGTGWSKSADSVTEGKPNQQPGSSGGPDLRPNWAKPAQASTATTDQSNAQAVQQPAPAAPSAATVANNREFPTLAASVATTRGTTAADAKPPNAWGSATGAATGNQHPEVVTPVVPVTQAPSSGYIGASGPKNADRKLPERYYGGPDAQPRPAAPKKYDIRQKLAQLSVESKEPPTDAVGEPKSAEKSATPEDREERRAAAVLEEKPMPVFHPPDFSQPPPPVPPQNVSHAHGHGQAARPPYNQQRSAPQSQDVRQYSQHHPPPSGPPPPQATDGWNFDYEERHRGPPSAPPSGHGDTGYPPPYGQMPPPSGAYHHQQRSFGAGDADYQRHRGYDSRATEGGYPPARFEETKPPTYPPQSMGYGDSRYGGSGSFVNPPQETGWGDEPLRRHERSPSTQQAQQQRYRADSRGTSESESGWYAPIGGRPPSYASNSVRPAETGWGDPVRPPSYPTPNAPTDSSMDVGSYHSRSRTTSYNNAPTDGNFGGTFMSPGRDSAVDKSRQKRRVGNESSNASEGELGTVAQSSGFDTLDQSASDFDHSGSFNGQKDFPRRGNDRNIGNQRPRGGSQRSAHQSQEQPAYRMLKRNDEKSAQYLAHHGGSFLPSSDLVESATRGGDDEHAMQSLQSLKASHKRHAGDPTEPREQESGPHRSGKHAGGGERNTHRYDQQGHGAKNQPKKHQHQARDSAKESPKTTHAAAPEAQKPTGPPTTQAVKTAVPPPPPENVWEKRMEERQKSAERDNGIQKPLKHLETHFPPISEADKAAERLKAAEQEDIFAGSQRQKYEHQDARYGQPGQQNRRQHGGQNPRQNQWRPPAENGSRWDEHTGADEQSRPVNDGDEESHFEDNTYEGTRREFYNSRNRGVGRRAPTAGVGLAGRVKRHGVGRDAHRTHPVQRRAPDPDESDYKLEAKPSRNRDEPADSFANMGEFHAEDYAIPDEPANRGKSKKGGQPRGSEHDGSASAEGVKDIEPSHARPEKRPHNGGSREKGSFGNRYSGAYPSGRNWQRGGIRSQQDRQEVPTGMELADDVDAERSNGIDNETEKADRGTTTTQYRNGPRRGGRGGYSDRPRGGVRKTAQFGNKFGQARSHRPSDRRSFHTGEGTGSLKSPITSDGAGEEWETASESSDFAERSGRQTHTKEQSPHDNEHQKKRPPNRDRPTRARPSHNRNGHNGDASEQLSRDADARSFELTSERQSQNSRRPTGPKNAKPASHTYQDRNAFGKNNSESAKMPTNSRPKQLQGAVHAGNSRAESVSNDSKNARDSRKGAGTSTASVPSVKDGLAGVDINDASVIVIDDHPDIPQSESHSEAGEFEEVLSKKSKKIRQQELEEERKKEQRERERQEKALARKNKAQQQRADKAAARKAERKSASEPPKEASEASVKSLASSEVALGNDATGANELLGLTKEQQSNVLSTLNGTAMDEFVATVWNSSRVTAKVTNAMESAPKVIPSPIARPTPKTSNASMHPTNNEKSTVEFSTSSSFGTPTMPALSKSGSTTTQYDFTLEPALTTGNESTELPTLTESSESGLLALRPTAGITLPSTTATMTSSEHIQLQEKLDKVKDVWSGEQTQADFRTSAGLIGATEAVTTTSPEKAPGNTSLSQAHGPNVAKVKPQPQIPSLDPVQQGRSAHAGDQSHFASSSRDMKAGDQGRLSGATDTHPPCYLSTSTHVPLAPQSPLTSSLMPQGASLMFGMGPFTPTAASHNSFPPFPMMPNSGDFMPQSFAPQLPANSPPSQFFGQNVFAQRSRPNSFIESHPMLMTTHPPHNSGNASATPWSAGPSGSMEMLGNGCLTPSQPQMAIGPTSVFAAGNVYGNASGNTRFAGQQHAFVTGNAHHSQDFSSQPPSRPPTAVSAGTGHHGAGMNAFPLPNNGGASGFTGPNLSIPPPPIGTVPPAMPPTHLPPPTHMPPPNIRPPQFLAGPFAVAPSNLGPMSVQRSVPSHPGGNNVGVEARIFSNVPGNFARGFPAFPPQGVIIRQAPPPPPTHHFLPNGGHQNRPPPQHGGMPQRRPESQQNARSRDSPSTNAESLRSSQVSAQTPPATWGAQKTDQTSASSARNPANGFDLFKMNFSTSSAS